MALMVPAARFVIVPFVAVTLVALIVALLLTLAHVVVPVTASVPPTVSLCVTASVSSVDEEVELTFVAFKTTPFTVFVLIVVMIAVGAAMLVFATSVPVDVSKSQVTACDVSVVMLATGATTVPVNVFVDAPVCVYAPFTLRAPVMVCAPELTEPDTVTAFIVVVPPNAASLVVSVPIVPVPLTTRVGMVQVPLAFKVVVPTVVALTVGVVAIDALIAGVVTAPVTLSVPAILADPATVALRTVMSVPLLYDRLFDKRADVAASRPVYILIASPVKFDFVDIVQV